MVLLTPPLVTCRFFRILCVAWLVIFAGSLHAEPGQDELALPRDVMPAAWKLPPPQTHPCLLFGPEDRGAIKARVLHQLGSLSAMHEHWLEAYLSDEQALHRKATDDFVKYWQDYSKRWTPENLDRHDPDGVSMRGIWRTLYVYDLVKSYGLLTPAQEQEYKDTLVKAVQLALGSTPGTHRSPGNFGWRSMNIYSDVAIAAGTVGLMFPDVPQSREWVDYAVRLLQSQLNTVVWDGAWHESPRYHSYMVYTSGLFYRSLLRRTGKDMFQDPRFKGLLNWTIRFETPLDKVAGATLGLPGGVSLSPAMGDSAFENEPFCLLAMFAPQYVKSDPAFAGRLMWGWQRGGSNYLDDWSRALIDPDIAPIPQTLGSDCSPGKGYVEMWSGFNTPAEKWLLMRCGRQTMAGHDEADWNAFNLAAFGVPLALASQSGDYNMPEHKQWHDKAIAHNTVVFGDRSQERRTGNVLSFVTQPELDYSITDASVPAVVRKYVRHTVFVKPDYFVVWDQLDSTESTNWVMHTPAAELQWSEHRIRAVTPWNVELDAHVVYPAAPLKPWQDKGRFGSWRVEGGKKNDPYPFDYQLYFKVPNAPGSNDLVVLHPRRTGEAELQIKSEGTPQAPVLVITCGEQQDRIALSDHRLALTRNGPHRCALTIEGNQAPPTDVPPGIQAGAVTARSTVNE